MKITDYKLQITKWVLMGLVALLVSGCIGNIRGKGGKTAASLPGVQAQADQPENPKDATTQDVNSETDVSYTVPAGSTIVEEPAAATIDAGVPSQTKTKAPDVGAVQDAARGSTPSVVQKITVSEPMLVTKHTKHSAATTVGAAQVDTVGKMVATLKSVRWIQVVGFLFLVFGIASLAWPPLRMIVNSATTSAWCIGSGAFLIFVTPVVAVHPVLCLSIAAGVCGLWYFAHTHGGVTAELATVKNWLSSELGASAPDTSPVKATQPAPAAPVAPAVAVAPVTVTTTAAAVPTSGQ